MASGWHLQTMGIRGLGEELGHTQGHPCVLQGIVPGEGKARRHQQSTDARSGEDHVCRTI